MHPALRMPLLVSFTTCVMVSAIAPFFPAYALARYGPGEASSPAIAASFAAFPFAVMLASPLAAWGRD